MDTRLRKLLLGFALTASVAYVLVVHAASIRPNVGRRDSIQYWSAGQLLIRHQNPYDASSVIGLERQQGYTEDRPLVVRTPPWSLFIFLPLGLLNAFSGWLLWISASLASLILAMRLCWRMFGQADDLRSIFLVVGYTFAPVLACLLAAQIGFVLLLGIVLFLALEARRPFLAGAALILPFTKPHLLVFFWLAFLLWIVVRKKFAVAGGFAVALFFATILALVFDPNIFKCYRDMLHTAAIEGEFIPTFSGVLRLMFFRHSFKAQFIPTLLGLIWCVWFCVKNMSKWDWRHHGLTVMVVSILTSPYGWLTDEVVLLPAVLFAAMCIFGERMKIRMNARIALMVFAFLNSVMLLLLISKVPLQSGIYFWSSLLWFVWYFYGRSRLRAAFKAQPKEVPAVS